MGWGCLPEPTTDGGIKKLSANEREDKNKPRRPGLLLRRRSAFHADRSETSSLGLKPRCEADSLLTSTATGDFGMGVRFYSGKGGRLRAFEDFTPGADERDARGLGSDSGEYRLAIHEWAELGEPEGRNGGDTGPGL